MIVSATNYYASPTGASTNQGTIDSPYNLTQGLSKTAAAGDTLYLRGGVYELSAKTSYSKSGNASSRVVVAAYEGEQPIFDFRKQPYGSSNTGFSISSNYAHIKGIVVRYAGDNGFYISGSNNIIENCVAYRNCDSGFQLKSGTNNLILNCDSYENFDYQSSTVGGNADGFADKQYSNSAGANTYDGCRSWSNSDDGWDHYEKIGSTMIRNSICYKNGPSTYDMTNHPRYTVDKTWFDKQSNLAAVKNSGNGNGFKVGGNYTAHDVVVHHCIAVKNKVKGFDQNNNNGKMEFYNCSGYNNSPNYGFTNSNYGALTLKNSLSLGTAANKFSAKSNIVVNNSWDLSGVSCTNSDFESLDDTQLLSTRQVDGSLSIEPFLRLVAGSSMIDRGLDLGYPYKGSAPDLGAYEYEVVSAIQTPAYTPVDHYVYAGHLFIETQEAISRVDIYNASGANIHSCYSGVINLATLGNGLFIVKVIDAKAQLHTIKLIR